jgi:hypothetical protein
MKNIAAVVIIIAAISFLPQIASAQGATTCNGAATTVSGILGSIVFDMQTSSSTYGLIVNTNATAGKFIVPFSFPKFDILYAELLLIQKSPILSYKIDYTVDASNILCSMTVKRIAPAAPSAPVELPATAPVELPATAPPIETPSP